MQYVLGMNTARKIMLYPTHILIFTNLCFFMIIIFIYSFSLINSITIHSIHILTFSLCFYGFSFGACPLMVPTGGVHATCACVRVLYIQLFDSPFTLLSCIFNHCQCVI